MSLTPRELRPLFPALARVGYLNAAAASPIALPVEKAIAEHYREAVEWGDIGFRAWVKRKEDIRAQVAHLIGAALQELAFVSSTSMGFHLVGCYLQQLGVREVVTLAQEFPSTTLPLLNLGFKLRVVSPRPDGTYALEDIAAAIRKSTGAVAASIVQYSSGFRIDVSKLAQLCQSRDVYLAVNGSQALGQTPVDVSGAEIDFLCATSHKWLMGGFGIDVLYVRKQLLSELKPPIAGWLSTDQPMAMDNLAGATVTPTRSSHVRMAQGARFRPEASALEIGGMAWGPLFGFGAALELLERVGMPAITAQISALQRVLRPRLRSLGFVPNLDDDFDHGSGICVFPVEGSAEGAARELAKQGVFVSARGGGLRVSTHVFNSEVEVDQLFWALDKAGIAPPQQTQSTSNGSH